MARSSRSCQLDFSSVWLKKKNQSGGFCSRSSSGAEARSDPAAREYQRPPRTRFIDHCIDLGSPGKSWEVLGTKKTLKGQLTCARASVVFTSSPLFSVHGESRSAFKQLFRFQAEECACMCVYVCTNQDILLSVCSGGVHVHIHV